MTCLLAVYEKALPDYLSWREKLVAAGNAGFDGLELSIDESDERLGRLDWSLGTRRDLLALTRNTGVYINTICLSGHRKYPMGSADSAIRNRSVAIAEKTIELAYDMGIHIVMLPGYDVYYEKSDAVTKAYFVENLRKVVDYAASRGVRIAFETMENDFMNTTEKAMKYVSEIASPYLNVYPDIGNITNGTPDPQKDLRTGAGWICAAHLKETREGIFRNLMYGEGRVDFRGCIKVLKELGVRMFTAEFWYQGEPDFSINLKKAHDFLRPLLN